MPQRSESHEEMAVAHSRGDVSHRLADDSDSVGMPARLCHVRRETPTVLPGALASPPARRGDWSSEDWCHVISNASEHVALSQSPGKAGRAWVPRNGGARIGAIAVVRQQQEGADRDGGSRL